MGPAPTETAVAALAGCTNTIGNKCAKALDIDAGLINVEIECDFDRRGVIQLDSFIAMCVTLHNAKRLHASLADPATPGRSSFDFNQFVWAVALL